MKSCSCGSYVRKDNLIEHKETKKHYYDHCVFHPLFKKQYPSYEVYLRAISPISFNVSYFTCTCGAILKRGNDFRNRLKHHKDSQKHKEYEKPIPSFHITFKKQCRICCKSKSNFVSCVQCNRSACKTCILNLKKPECPFCRYTNFIEQELKN